LALIDKYLTQSTDIAWRTIGDDTVIVSIADSTLFVLNAVGTAIWNAADGTIPLSQIIRERVCAEFDVTEEQALADAQEFIGELTKHGILLMSESPASPKDAR
jgi:hypothetical protein